MEKFRILWLSIAFNTLFVRVAYTAVQMEISVAAVRISHLSLLQVYKIILKYCHLISDGVYEHRFCNTIYIIDAYKPNRKERSLWVFHLKFVKMTGDLSELQIHLSPFARQYSLYKACTYSSLNVANTFS